MTTYRSELETLRRRVLELESLVEQTGAGAASAVELRAKLQDTTSRLVYLEAEKSRLLEELSAAREETKRQTRAAAKARAKLVQVREGRDDSADREAAWTKVVPWMLSIGASTGALVGAIFVGSFWPIGAMVIGGALPLGVWAVAQEIKVVEVGERSGDARTSHLD